MGCQTSKPVVVEKPLEETTAANNNNNNKECPACLEFQYTKDTCALEYWEPIQLLGEGSISSIHLVRKRPQRVNVPYQERVDIMDLACCKAAKTNNNISCCADIDSDDDARLLRPVYAMKSIMKDHIGNDRYLQEMRDEIYTMSCLAHAHIVRVHEAFERKKHIYLIMDYCRGGDLTGRNTIVEAETCLVVQQILEAIQYCHSHKVVHRDLKLENVMFQHDEGEESTDSDSIMSIKIIDFGLATKYLSSEYKTMTARVGTLYSMAPQVLQGVYDSKCDLWSIGVITYILLCPKQLQPFYGPPREMAWEKRKKIMIDRIMRCEYMKMKGPSWNNVSQEAKDFVASLLQMDPSKRPSAKKALEMPWIKNQQQQQQQQQQQPPRKSMIPAQNIQYKEKRSLEKIAPMVIANELTGNEIVLFKQRLQKEYDKAQTDSVTMKQFRSCYIEFVKEIHPDSIVSPVFSSDHDAIEAARTTENTRTTGSTDSIKLDYIHLLHEALDRRLQKLQETLLQVFPQAENDASVQIPCDQLRTVLAKHDDMSDASMDVFLQGVNGEDLALVVRYQDAVKRLRDVYLQKMDDVCICDTCGKDGDYSKEDDDDDEDLCDLANAINSVIPGGKNDPSDSGRLRFAYDEATKSMHRSYNF